MKRMLLLAPLALLFTQPHAQGSKSKVGIVNVQTVVASMPGGAPFVTLSKQADLDIQTQTRSLQALRAKAANRAATAADRAAFTSAQKSFQALAVKYDKQLQTAFVPLANRVNSAVTYVARSGGFSVVLDHRVAQSSGLVLYANSQATDMTAAVTARVKAAK